MRLRTIGRAMTAALVLLVAGGAAPAREIQEVERAFAQTVAQSGIAAGFRQFAASDAVMFLPDPVPAQGALARAAWPGQLSWKVQYLGMAPSGDLAFSAGPSLLRSAGRASGGYYVAVWRRQTDGGWRFLLDHAADMPAAAYGAAAAKPVIMNTDPPPGAPSGEGMREADGALNGALPRGGPMAFGDRLDDQAVVVRTGRAPAAGRRRALTLVSASPAILDAVTLGAGRSADGSFGYTYGRARWSAGGASQAGYYVRIWRATPQGWRLLFDHLAER